MRIAAAELLGCGLLLVLRQKLLDLLTLRRVPAEPDGAGLCPPLLRCGGLLPVRSLVGLRHLALGLLLGLLQGFE